MGFAGLARTVPPHPEPIRPPYDEPMIGSFRRDPEDLVVRLALCAAALTVATAVAAGRR